ncbi:MAG: NUDIX domain-containing protein [Methyloprofundus sp.]|nr:NUDIX domain-containing protein [Methyloprofundus sp.]
MNSELIPVVNEQDIFIENRPRKEVHRLGLRHRAVHILVFNDMGQLFLQKRSLTKDINAGLWDTSAAGHVDANESYDACAHRETIEELGVCVGKTLSYICKITAKPETGMEFVQVYRCQHNGPFTLEAAEIDDGQWFSIADISQRVANDDPSLTDTFKTLWLKFRKLGHA